LHIFSPDDESCSGFLLPKTLILCPLCFRVKIFSKYICNCLHGISAGCIFDLSITQKERKMNYSTITCDAFVAELAEFFKTTEEYHRARACAYESLLRQFGFTNEQIDVLIKDAKNKR